MGDRVAVYVGAARNIEPKRLVGEVVPSERIDMPADWVSVRFDDYCRMSAHVKQCRRLKKRERRRVWVKVWALDPLKNDGDNFMNIEPVNKENYIEFVEARKK